MAAPVLLGRTRERAPSVELYAIDVMDSAHAQRKCRVNRIHHRQVLRACRSRSGIDHRYCGFQPPYIPVDIDALLEISAQLNHAPPSMVARTVSLSTPTDLRVPATISAEHGDGQHPAAELMHVSGLADIQEQ